MKWRDRVYDPGESNQNIRYKIHDKKEAACADLCNLLVVNQVASNWNRILPEIDEWYKLDASENQYLNHSANVLDAKLWNKNVIRNCKNVFYSSNGFFGTN
jgi:hypothetical protein